MKCQGNQNRIKRTGRDVVLQYVICMNKGYLSDVPHDIQPQKSEKSDSRLHWICKYMWCGSGRITLLQLGSAGSDVR
jgi:hypothetical protein